MLAYIQQMQDLMEEEEYLRNRWQQLTCHRIKDFSLIGDIYDWFMELLPEKTLENRRKFIFTVLYFYSPGTLAGNKTCRGVRGEIAKVIHDCSPTRISHHCVEVSLYFRCYKSFRIEMEDIIVRMTEKLKQEGIITNWPAHLSGNVSYPTIQ